MKKLYGLILASILTTNMFALGNGDLYLEVTKQTNGGYQWKIPALKTEIQQNKFLYVPELSLKFTSPRGRQFDINHYSFDFNNNIGFKVDDFYFSFSLGMEYIFEGNDMNLDEGFTFYNTMRIGLKF